jgi:drug/metabolite transporter (DMT)-like permease
MFNKSYFLLLISVISISFSAIIILSINSNPLTIAFYRMLFTTIIISIFLISNENSIKELLGLDIKKIFYMILIGIILAAHFSFWITSLKLTSIASSVILVSIHPIVIGPISFYFLKEKLSKFNILGIILAFIGIIILVYGNYGLNTITIDTIEGNLYALLGGIAAGFYIIGGKKIRRNTSLLVYTFIVYGFSTITLFFICLIFSTKIIILNSNDFILILLLAIISGILGHTLYNYVLKYFKTSIVSVALLGEPLGSTLLAYAIPWINQIPSNYTILGGIIILIGIYLTSLQKRFNKNENLNIK